MKTKIILIAVGALVLSSCSALKNSSVYDDVYFVPGDKDPNEQFFARNADRAAKIDITKKRFKNLRMTLRCCCCC